MPGVLHHLLFAEEVFKRTQKHLHEKGIPFLIVNGSLFLSKKDVTLKKSDFFLGNTVPDLGRDKKKSHFRVRSGIARGFQVPELFWAKKQLAKMENKSLKLGIFAHLYLDKRFIEGFLYPRFEFDWPNKKVRDKRTSREYQVNEFFSPKGLYYGYSELNRAIMDRKMVNMDYVHCIPEWPERVGLEVYDDRRSKSWREELFDYLSGMTETSDTVFVADEFTKFILDSAASFVQFEMGEYF